MSAKYGSSEAENLSATSVLDLNKARTVKLKHFDKTIIMTIKLATCTLYIQFMLEYIVHIMYFEYTYLILWCTSVVIALSPNTGIIGDHIYKSKVIAERYCTYMYMYNVHVGSDPFLV